MQTRIYSIRNLDCANCAAKAEEKIRKVPGVGAASITFATMQLRITAVDPDALLPQVLAAARTVEAEIQFLPHREGHHHEHHEHCDCDHHDHQEGCGCGHHHDHHHHHAPEQADGELTGLLLGGGLFLVGLLLRSLIPGLPVYILPFLAAYGLLGWDVLKTAGRNLGKGRVFDENFLMSLATLGAFAIGEFPEAVGVMLFYRVGAHFEHRAVERSRKSIMDVVDLRPEVVLLATGQTIPAADAQVGDLVLVRPGDRIPLDGVVVEGDSRMDTAPITGESVPVGVHCGDSVLSGCVNVSGQLVIRVEKGLSESMVTRILNSVENAAAGKPRIDRFITRFARIYTPIVVAAAAAVAVVPALFTGNWGYWVYTALSFLVMSCPCALVLSVPLAFFSGIGAGSKRGILFKDGLSIEALAGVQAVVMDKTGTITKGDFSVQEADDELLRISACCEQHSTHPIAASIVAAARQRGLDLIPPEALEEIPGHGIRATLAGREVLCGNEKLMALHGIQASSAPGVSTVHVAVDGVLRGSITISDTLKPDAADAVKELKTMGVATAMLTGDNPVAAEAVAGESGIETVYAGLLPEDKLEKLRAIRAEKGAVMFVGDGINDAPVLSGADVGAAMGSGADAAIEAADVVFMTSQAAAIPEAVRLARLTRQIAWQNVVFALGVKAAVMALGLLGHASMWAAVFADSGVAMLCVLNAIRMLYRKK